MWSLGLLQALIHGQQGLCLEIRAAVSSLLRGAGMWVMCLCPLRGPRRSASGVPGVGGGRQEDMPQKNLSPGRSDSDRYPKTQGVSVHTPISSSERADILPTVTQHVRRGTQSLIALVTP